MRHDGCEIGDAEDTPDRETNAGPLPCSIRVASVAGNLHARNSWLHAPASLPLSSPYALLCVPMQFLCAFYAVSMRFLYRFAPRFCLSTSRFPRENVVRHARRRNPSAVDRRRFRHRRGVGAACLRLCALAPWREEYHHADRTALVDSSKAKRSHAKTQRRKESPSARGNDRPAVSACSRIDSGCVLAASWLPPALQ